MKYKGYRLSDNFGLNSYNDKRELLSIDKKVVLKQKADYALKNKKKDINKPIKSYSMKAPRIQGNNNNFFNLLLLILVVVGYLIYKKGGNLINAVNPFVNNDDNLYDNAPVNDPLTASANADIIENYMNGATTDEESIFNLINKLNSTQLDDLFLSFGNRINWTLFIPSSSMNLFAWYDSELLPDEREILKAIYATKPNLKYKYQ